MKTSQKGIELLKLFEGCVLKAYKAHFSEKYWTIGYGHYGPDVVKGMVITKEAAEKMLISDLQSYEDKVNKYNNIYKWNQNEFDALVSFCYNIGNIDQLTAKGTRTKTEVRDKIRAYVYCNGYKLQGLINRRQKEYELFIAPCTSALDNSSDVIVIPDPTLRRRCKSERVGQLQELCNKYFGKSLKIDNSYGPLTQQAIKEIQSASGKLEADGIYGPKTYAYFKEVCK